MWKTVGSVCDEGDKSVRSNRSRMDADVEPFHQSIKRRSNLSPQANRSFCQDYFERHRNHNLSFSAYSNKSEKNLKGHSVEKDDMFTEIRNKAHKQQLSSKVDSIKENPQGADPRAGLKKAQQRVSTLKKDQKKLKKTLESEFDHFKNFFYQMEQRIHQVQTVNVSEPIQQGQKVDEQLMKNILSEALEVERYFADMDRRKTTLMQQLTG